jgi:ADP-L-glycero-D-manno-heptose 6-epimerase
MLVITGGAGFIGSALVWGFNLRGVDNILIVDSLGDSDKWKNLVNLKFADYLDKDIFIERLQRGVFDKIEGIIHMGAWTNTIETNADVLISNNFEYSKQLAQWCIEHNKRFVYASSAATYGDGRSGFSDDHKFLDKLKPLNIYGYSKHLFDLWLYRNGYLNRVAGLKYFNVFGPNEYHKKDMRSIIVKAFEQIKESGKVKLFKSYNPDYKDGHQKRDFIYVKDAVKMTLFVFINPEINGIFNVGTGCARTFYEAVLYVFKAMDKEVNIEYIDMPDSIRPKYQYFTEAQIDKICSFGYDREMYTLEDAVNDYIKDYLLKEDPHLKVNSSVFGPP